MTYKKRKECPICKKEFLPNHPARKYCGENCTLEAKQENYRTRRRGTRYVEVNPHSNASIAKIAAQASELGLSYGRYVQQMGEAIHCDKN